MTADAIREIIAREIWAYNECPWDFDKPPGGMAQLQKQMAIDQAERIRAVLEKTTRERCRKLVRFIMTGQREE